MNGVRVGAWLVWAACVVLTAAGLVLWFVNRTTPVPNPFSSRDATAVAAAAFLALPTLGALIVSRRPEVLLGWMFSAIGSTMAVWSFVDGYAVQALVVAPGSLAGGELAAWLGQWIWVPGWGLVALLFLLFPDGSVPSPRWRVAGWAVLCVVVAAVTLFATAPGPLRDYPYVDNPLGVPGLPSGGVVPALGYGLLVAIGLACMASLLARLRGARGVTRQQLKVLAYAGCVAVGSIAPWLLLEPLGVSAPWAEYLTTLTSVGIPVAAALAVLRYRVGEIDHLINRTIVYSLLTVGLGLAYFAGVLILGRLLAPVSGGSALSTAASTLAVAGAFRPARARVQAAVDRRFYRSRYDAAVTVAAFSQRLRDHLELEQLTAELLTVVDDTLQPREASLWLLKR